MAHGLPDGLLVERAVVDIALNFYNNLVGVVSLWMALGHRCAGCDHEMSNLWINKVGFGGIRDLSPISSTQRTTHERVLSLILRTT